MKGTVRLWGSGLGLRIPQAVADRFGLSIGTKVEFDTSRSVLVVRFRRRRKYTLARLLAGAKGPSPHRGLDRDPPVGRELRVGGC